MFSISSVDYISSCDLCQNLKLKNVFMVLLLYNIVCNVCLFCEFAIVADDKHNITNN